MKECKFYYHKLDDTFTCISPHLKAAMRRANEAEELLREVDDMLLDIFVPDRGEYTEKRKVHNRITAYLTLVDGEWDDDAGEKP